MRRLAMMVLLVAFGGCRKPTAPEARVLPDVLRVRVRVTRPAAVDLAGMAPLVGTLRPWQHAVLSARVSGDVLSLAIERGDRVEKGKLLGALRVPGLPQQAAAAIANGVVAEAAWSEQKEISDRVKSVASANSAAVSAQEVALAAARAETARAKVLAARAEASRASALMSDARVVAPFDGVIVNRFVDAGSSVGAGDKLVELADISTLRLVLDIPERLIFLAHTGASVAVILPALGDRRVDAKISRFAPALDAATRSLRVEIDLHNDGSLFAGTEARVRFTDAQGKVLTIPAGALVVDAKGIFVFLVRDGRAIRRPIEIGADDGARVEVRRGLTADDEVVVGGGGLLADGDSIEVAR